MIDNEPALSLFYNPMLEPIKDKMKSIPMIKPVSIRINKWKIAPVLFSQTMETASSNQSSSVVYEESFPKDLECILFGKGDPNKNKE